MATIILDNTNNTCPSSLLWSQSALDSRRPIFYACIIAAIIHSVFWVQLVFCPSVRQKSMQWLYAYLITDILLLLRFFFLYIVHTTSNECTSRKSWSLFICYFEATVDNYLNITEVYILLALNICRYEQIAHNQNVYTKNIRLLICAHLTIYLIPVIIFAFEFYMNWAQLYAFVGDSCFTSYMNVYTQVFNIIIAFALPIILNISVICASIRHVHLTSHLRRAQQHTTAREKYHRSLVIQFVAFYIIWFSLWPPNVIVNQLTTTRSDIQRFIRLLNYIEIAIDPIIISALDVRFLLVWRNIWIHLNNRYFKKLQPQQRKVQPVETNAAVRLPGIPQVKPV